MFLITFMLIMRSQVAGAAEGTLNDFFLIRNTLVILYGNWEITLLRDKNRKILKKLKID